VLSKRTHAILSVGNLKVGPSMNEKPDILQGMLALMVLKTLVVPGSQHGYGIARRIKQISGDILALNQGSLYLLLLKLEHEGSIVSRWDASENNRRARFYSLTATGRKQLQTETSDWNQTVSDLFNLIVRENGMLAGLLSPPPNTGAKAAPITYPEKMQEALKASYVDLQKAITGLSDNDLQAPVKLFGRDITKRAALMRSIRTESVHDSAIDRQLTCG
jgi:PadR family transcriptional regulator PadR